MPSLRDQQAMLQGAILAPEENAPILSRLHSPRIAVYRHGYRARLAGALRQNDPALARVMGDEAFETIAGEYARAFPSRTFSIRWHGADLYRFLDDLSRRDMDCRTIRVPDPTVGSEATGWRDCRSLGRVIALARLAAWNGKRTSARCHRGSSLGRDDPASVDHRLVAWASSPGTSRLSCSCRMCAHISHAATEITALQGSNRFCLCGSAVAGVFAIPLPFLPAEHLGSEASPERLGTMEWSWGQLLVYGCCQRASR